MPRSNRVLRWFAPPLLLACAAALASGVRAMFPDGQRFLGPLAISAALLVLCAGLAIGADLVTERNRRWERPAAVMVAVLAMALAIYCGLLAALVATSLAASA